MKLFSFMRKDGFLHFETSLLIVLILSLYLPLWLSILGAVAVGIAKELWDKEHDGVASWNDVLCDLAGVLVGMGLYLLAHLT